MDLDSEVFTGGASYAPPSGKELEELLFGSDLELEANDEAEAEEEGDRDSGDDEDGEGEGHGFEYLFDESAPEPEHEDSGANQDLDVSESENSPEKAVKQGLKMVNNIKKSLKDIKLSGWWREEVWEEKVKNLTNWKRPDTLIAVCGATGAGKSSIINAVLQDNIVPTSSMRACTSVVTEIRYHKFADKRNISAEVSFLTLSEWKNELDILLKDVQEGRPKREADLDGDAAIAYSKVHAVYPNITLGQLMTMGVDSILATNPIVLELLGKTRHIVAKNSKAFGKEIAPYIGPGRSTVRHSLSSDDSDSEGDFSEEEESHSNGVGVEGQTFWPLICKVVIKCRAKALSTGAILVDLPGVKDLDFARNNIAKEYMKKADFFWILADINRAVSDKIAKGEVFVPLVRDWGADILVSRPSWRSIQWVSDCVYRVMEEAHAHLHGSQDGSYNTNAVTFVASKCDELQCHEVINELNLRADPEFQKIQCQIDRCKKRLDKHKLIRERSKNTAESVKKQLKKLDRDHKKSAQKRKNTECTGPPPHKRRKTSSGECASVLYVPPDTNDQTEYEFLQQKLRKAKEDRAEAGEKIEDLDGQLSLFNKKRKGFCSIKRSQFSRKVLQEDFRQGLKRHDEIVSEQADPRNYDPTCDSDSKAYGAVDLNVFTCSSRDYMVLKGLIDNHGESTCFTDVEQTGIPALQTLCNELTIRSRNRAAQEFLARLSAFIDEVEKYIALSGEATAKNQKELRERWESRDPNAKCLNAKPRWRVAHHIPNDATGIVPRLCKAFSQCIDKIVDDLKRRFQDTLKERCVTGAADATKQAYVTVERFMNQGHWTKFRAAIRRHGAGKDFDLNWELLKPFTRNIAHAWIDTFRSNLFHDFDRSIKNTMLRLLFDIELSASEELRSSANEQGIACLALVDSAMREILHSLGSIVKKGQQSISYSMLPYLREELRDTYAKTLDFRGQGCIEDQKSYFLSHVCKNIKGILERGNTNILSRLDEIADDVGKALRARVGFGLAQAIEVHLAALWDEAYDDPVQTHARKRMQEVVAEAQDQLLLWKATQSNVNLNALKDSAHENGDIEMSET